MITKTATNRRLAAATGACVLLCGLITGCGGSARITLDQPFAPPSQRELTLESNWAFCSESGGRRECLLQFPLPGASEGPRDFHLYLAMPDVDERLTVIPDDSDSVRGFLIQAVGDLRGKTNITGGTVRCRSVWLRSSLRRIEVSLECADGTRIAGEAKARVDRSQLQTFRRQFASDVDGSRQLEPAVTEAGAPEEPTTPRRPG